ncbi:hypothetical protein MA16_Dca002340 [Dendrobium catenatum]|uniref:Uncharacterized protein n=1 Tax=Dendrobium catenatum TaxID=906689 RepID=A0A2I0W080_9ASPA|nr:hypothetical protein MA16_Dca002340 [Dendrobium catenatum]
MSDGGPAEMRASSGGPTEQRRQAVVGGEGLKWWSDGATTSGSGLAEVRASNGGSGSNDVKRWSGGDEGLKWWFGESPVVVDEELLHSLHSLLPSSLLTPVPFQEK